MSTRGAGTIILLPGRKKKHCYHPDILSLPEGLTWVCHSTAPLLQARRPLQLVQSPGVWLLRCMQLPGPLQTGAQSPATPSSFPQQPHFRWRTFLQHTRKWLMASSRVRVPIQFHQRNTLREATACPQDQGWVSAMGTAGLFPGGSASAQEDALPCTSYIL